MPEEPISRKTQFTQPHLASLTAEADPDALLAIVEPSIAEGGQSLLAKDRSRLKLFSQVWRCDAEMPWMACRRM